MLASLLAFIFGVLDIASKVLLRIFLTLFSMLMVALIVVVGCSYALLHLFT